MTRRSPSATKRAGRRGVALWGLLSLLLISTATPVEGQVGGAPLLAGGGGPMVELLLLNPDKLGVPGLPDRVLLQGGGGFGRYQAWRVGGAGAAGQVEADSGASFSLSYGGVTFAYLPGAYGALPLSPPRTSFGALFGLGMATLQQVSKTSTLAFILFRPEAAIEFALGSVGTLQLGASYSFPIPLGSTEGGLKDLRAIQRPGFRAGLVFGGF